MAKIRTNLIGVVTVDELTLYPGDEVPEGVTVGDHVLDPETVEESAEPNGDPDGEGDSGGEDAQGDDPEEPAEPKKPATRARKS